MENKETEEEKVLEEEDISDENKIIEDLEKKVKELEDKLLRQLAECENIRNRSEKTNRETRDYAIFAFTKDLVPVMDNLSRALEHIPEESDETIKNIVAGIKMTKAELESVFKNHSLEVIEPKIGDKFDYNNHHAISQESTDKQDEGTIVNTMQVGYKIKERLIRPAAVVVAKK